LLLTVALVTAPIVSLAEEKDDEDDGGFRWDEEQGAYLPTTEYEPGRGKTMLLATTFGVVTGILLGGTLLVFYWNPEADKNFDTMFITTGIIGFGGGIALGMTLPVGAAREDSAASLKLDEKKTLDLHLPAVGVAFEQFPQGIEPFWRANLFSLSF